MATSSPVLRLKRLARKLTAPMLSPIDGRVADVNRRIAHEGERVVTQVDRYASTASDVSSYVGAELRRLESTMRELASERLEEYYRERIELARTASLDYLDENLAWLINWATGHRGFAAQAEVWFNGPLSIEHGAGEVSIRAVNERIVEVPFAFAGLSRVVAGARILDVGSAESTFPLSAAALGYQVTAVEPRGLPYAHPNLTTVAESFQDWRAPTEPFAAAFVISTIEHVGLPAYGLESFGDADPGKGGDREMLQRIHGLLEDDGLLALTTPFGARAVDEFQRTYDEAGLDDLLEGWEVLERRVVARRSDLVWTADGDPEAGERGVAMLLATPART